METIRKLFSSCLSVTFIFFKFFFSYFFRLKISANKNLTDEKTPDVVAIGSNGVAFGPASFSVVQKTNSNTKVSTELGNDEGNAKDKAIFVLYEKFNGTLIHDPTLALEPNQSQFDYLTAIIIGSVVALVFVASIVFVVGLLVVFFVVPHFARSKYNQV